MMKQDEIEICVIMDGGLGPGLIVVANKDDVLHQILLQAITLLNTS